MNFIKNLPKNWKVVVNNDLKVYLGYEDYYYKLQNVHGYLENYVFEGILIPEGYYRKRSTAGFYFLDEDGWKYTMRISKVEEVLKGIVSGVVSLKMGSSGKIGFDGIWTFYKQGANYSVGLYHE